MANLNKVMLIGNLTRDPEIKYTPKGSAVADVGLAINRNYTLDSGEKREETVFVDVVLWGRLAELAGQYLKKGRSVYIEGRLQLDSWDDKQTGQKRTKMRVVGETMQFLGGPRGDSAGGGGEEEPSGGKPASRPHPASKPPAAKKPPTDPDLEPGAEEDDIPF